MLSEIDTYKHKIVLLCKSYNVRTLYAFGSILTDKFDKNSDIDLLVDFSNMSLEDYADNYFALKFALEETLNRQIDLIEEKALKNPYLKQSINQKRQLIYGQ